MSSELLPLAIEMALHGGDMLKRGFGTSYEIASKEGRHNLVTTYDRLVESVILQRVKERFPGHSFLGEESGYHAMNDVVWVVDPLDGTVNFAHNVPLFCVSIAAVRGSEVLVAAICQPMTGELFWAERGCGAFLNGKQLHVSSQASLEEAYVATGFPYHVEREVPVAVEPLEWCLRRGIPIRRLGSAAIDLAYVAAGRFDGYWELSLEPWDVAAGMLLVQEAGGVVMRYDGAACQPLEEGSVIAGNQSLCQQLQQVVRL